MDAKITLLVARQVWLAFRSACIGRGLVAGRVLEELMRQQLKRWASEKKKESK